MYQVLINLTHLALLHSRVKGMASRSHHLNNCLKSSRSPHPVPNCLRVGTFKWELIGSIKVYGSTLHYIYRPFSSRYRVDTAQNPCRQTVGVHISIVLGPCLGGSYHLFYWNQRIRFSWFRRTYPKWKTPRRRIFLSHPTNFCNSPSTVAFAWYPSLVWVFNYHCNDTSRGNP